MKINHHLALLSAASLCFFTSVNAQTKPVRWFEMEVIIFSQLGDKSQLKESFSTDTPLPRYRKIRDLLSPYLYPDIALLKQHLPICNTGTLNNSAVTKLNTPYSLSPLFPLKTIHILEEEMLIAEPQLNSGNALNRVTASNDMLIPKDLTLETNSLNATIPVLENKKIDDDKLSETLINLSSEELALIVTEQEQAKRLLAEVETTFTEEVYQYQPYSFSAELCRLSTESVALLKANDSGFNENYIELTEVDKMIDAAETPVGDEPYLISASSLQLHDAVKELKRSQEFRPLLHIGWRQAEPAINKKRSIPMHLFAGENLRAHYNKQYAQYQEDLAQAESSELALQQIMQLSPNGLENETRVNDSTALLNRQQVKINTLIERLAELPSDKQRILEELDALKNNNPLSTSLLSPPLAPEQDWSIDGLFNVHLNHYLYITADFNIANMSLAEQASKSLIKGEPQQIESIRFSQNRRVISKEIHYFDHPFMGMIVQIRRHKRVLPKVDTLEGLE